MAAAAAVVERADRSLLVRVGRAAEGHRAALGQPAQARGRREAPGRHVEGAGRSRRAAADASTRSTSASTRSPTRPSGATSWTCRPASRCRTRRSTGCANWAAGCCASRPRPSSCSTRSRRRKAGARPSRRRLGQATLHFACRTPARSNGRSSSSCPRSRPCRCRGACASRSCRRCSTGGCRPARALPSSRELARLLGLSRNTVTSAYLQLIDEGFLESRPRSGVYVARHISPSALAAAAPSAALGRRGVGQPSAASGAAPRWSARVLRSLSGRPTLSKPDQWRRYPYPFVYGTYDPQLFPTEDFRECCARSLARSQVPHWTPDFETDDVPDLVEQIRMRLLPKRGVFATQGRDPRHGRRAAGLLPARRGAVRLVDPARPRGARPSACAQQLLAARAAPGRGRGRRRRARRRRPAGARLPVRHAVAPEPDHRDAEPGAAAAAARVRRRAGLRRHRGRLRGREPLRRRADAGAEEPGQERPRDLRRLGVEEPVAGAAPRLHRRAGAADQASCACCATRWCAIRARSCSTPMRSSCRSAITSRMRAGSTRRCRSGSRSPPRRCASTCPISRSTLPQGGGSIWVRAPAWLDAAELSLAARGHGVLIEAGDVFFAEPARPVSVLSPAPVVDRGRLDRRRHPGARPRGRRARAGARRGAGESVAGARCDARLRESPEALAPSWRARWPFRPSALGCRVAVQAGAALAVPP